MCRKLGVKSAANSTTANMQELQATNSGAILLLIKLFNECLDHPAKWIPSYTGPMYHFQTMEQSMLTPVRQRVVGHIQKFPVGTCFQSRQDLRYAGIHCVDSGNHGRITMLILYVLSLY